MQRTFTGLALASALAAAGAHAADTTKLTVNGMVCAFCAQGIEKRIGALPQTQAVYVNLGKKIVAVQAREGQTLDEARLKSEITEAGYDVVKVETTTEPVSAIRAALAKKK